MIENEKYVYDVDMPFWANHAIATIISDDLDPVYVGVRKAFLAGRFDQRKLCRFLCAMELYYHIGFACQIAESTTESNFWDYMLANYEGTKRGTERRYFRGAQGLACLNYLKTNYEGPTDFFTAHHQMTYKNLLEAFKPVPAFGEYHSWKMADFYDRILGWPVAADASNHKALPKEPRAGLALVKKEMNMEDKSDEEVMNYCVKYLQDLGYTAPPDHDRLVNIMEVETAMCMLVHFSRGSDYVGKDLLDKHESLNGYGPMAEIIQEYMPKPVVKDFFSVPKDVVESLGLKVARAPDKEEFVDLFAMFG